MSSASSRNLRRSRRKTSPPMSYQGSHSDAVPADSVSSSLDLGPRAKVPKLEPPDEDSTSDLRTESLAQMVKRIISLREKLGEFERDLSDASKAGCVSSARTSTTTNFAHSGNYVSKGFAYLEVLDTNVLSAHERSPIPQPATDDVDIPSSSKDENCTVKRCPSNALPPIEIKVDSSANSSCPPFNDQQPSTSFAIHVSQASVSSEVNSRSTPRAGSVVRGPESSVERAAKQEAQVLARVAELRRRGLWTASRLPLCCDPPRNKTHWDYLLEEVRWMAVDFRQERNFKRQAARKFATHIARIARDKELEEERSQLRQVKEAKRICSIIAKMVRDFWQNVDKVVDFHAQEIIDSMKRKALDQQLELMVGQADKLSEMVQEGLAAEKLPDGSSEGENAEDGPLSGDADFGDIESESDDETTIAKAEEIDEEEEPNVAEELADLERQNNLELDDLLSSLPAGYLESMGLSRPGTSEETDRFNGSSMETQGSVLNLQDVKELGKTVDTKNEVDVDQAERSDLTTRSSSAISTKDEEDSRAVSDRSDQSKDVMSRINFGRLNSESSEDRQKELANIAEEALKLQPKGFTLETTQVKTQVPSLLRGALREYQMVGLDWLVTLYKKGLNGILADEMGLGKTIQTIALLAHLACDESNWGPHLIVVPTSVILNWEIEVKKWCPAFKILTYFGSQKERAEKRRGWSKTNAFHVCITSYKIVTQDIRAFKQKAWQYFILDEAQNIKNFKSQRWQTLLNIRARRRLLLTGTPLQNSLMELWSLMHFLMPTIFASHNDFKDWFSNPLTDMMEGNAEYNSQLVHRLHKVLRPFILRRLKSEVEKQLPEKTEHIIKCSLSKRQRYLYDDFMSRRSTRDNLRSGSVMSVLNIVMQLRKCCNHPNLFEPRPIVSPLSMRPVSVVYPAFLFNAVNREHDTGLPDIPECLQISRGFRGSAIVWSESRGLMLSAVEVEKRSYSSPPMPIPAVDGFKFVRPPPAKIFRQSSHHDLVSSPRSSSLNLPFTAADSGNIGEYYVCVDNGTARVFQLVTNSSGEPTVQECDPSAVTSRRQQERACEAVSAKNEGIGSEPISRCADLIEPKREVSERNVIPVMELPIVSQSTLRIGPAVDVNSALKTHTVMNKLEVRATCTVTGKFGSRNHTSSSYERCKNPSAGETIPYQTIGTSEVPNQRSRSSQQVSIVSSSNCVSSFSVNGISPAQEECCRTPVAKRRRITANKPEREPYSELIPSEIRKAIEEQRCLRHRYIANICQQRLSSPVARRSPYVANELLFILTRELKKRRNHRPLDDLNSNAIAVNAFECSEKLNWLSSKFLMWSEDVVKRFTVFVHGAVSSMPKVLPSSSGLPAYVRDVVKTSDVCCDSSLGDCTFAIAQLSSTMQRLQFPELRLIEYDCGKLQVLSTLLRSLFHSRHRCLIFTQMSRMLDVLQAFLSFHGYQYFRLDGTTNVEQRQAMMERFNADPKIFCFILSTRSGGIGVNLTGADTVIFYDSDWNPTMDAQAQDRCHRIGQTRNVTIYRLISERTIEENILKKAMVKRRLGEMAIDEGGFTPEFFKRGDNIRDLFEGDEAVSDVIGPIAVDDDLEVEKAMEIIEDDQDVVAAKRAKAEAKAELAEFDESQHALTENSSEKANDSKYIELINQLKPIERYAINFLEAEYKPDFEKEKKEAEAMLASKKDEWIKAHENVLEEDNTGVEHDDDDFFLTYPSGFGNIDEVRKSRSSSVKTSVQNNKRGRAGVIRTSSTRHSTRIPIANQPVASCSPPTSSPKKTYANSLPTPTLFTRTSRSSTRPHSRSRKSIKPLISKRVSDLKNAARRSSRLIRAGQATQTFPQKKDCTVGPDVFLPRKRGRPSLASKLAVASSAVADVAGTGTVNFPSASAVMTPISQKTRFQCSAASGSSASTVNFEESSLNSSSIQVTTDSSNFVSSSFSSSACSQSPTFRSPPVVRLLTVSQTSDSSPDGRRLVASDMTHQPTNSIYFSPQEAFRSSARRHFVIVRRSNSVVPQQRVQLVNGLSTDNASCSSVGTSSSPPHLLKVRTRIASRHSADCNIKPSLGDYERPRLSYRKSRSSSSSCDNNVVGSSSAGTHA